MINFFRNIRRQLANDNKFQKYFRYAFGEILLVVIGILIALQVNNWNEKRKQKVQFNETISKVYTSVNTNVEALYAYGEKILNDLILLEYFINLNGHPVDPIFSYENITSYYAQGQSKHFKRFSLNKANLDTIEPFKIPHLVYMLEHFVIADNSSSTNSYIESLNPNSSNLQEKDISQKITNFNNQFRDFSFNDTKDISTFLTNNNIPQPTSIFQSQVYFNWDELNNDQSTYTDQEISKTLILLKSDELKTLLRNCVSNKFREFRELINIYEEGRNLLSDLKTYNPNLILDYNIGIIGDAVEGWFTNSTPMVYSKPREGIWELDIALNDGQLKFRNNNSWAINWGGNKFPKGYTTFYGGNITLEKGNYHIILDLVNNTYEITKQDD